MINRGVLAAGALVVLANGAILANVARNRAGNPDAVVRLSEREAQAYLPPDEQAELMLILRLRWQTALGPAGEDTSRRWVSPGCRPREIPPIPGGSSG